MSKESFKNFVSQNPSLATYVENDTMTWQKFYELYDMYGESDEIWQKYLKPSPKITTFLDKVDPDNLKQHLDTAKKALDIFSELATKTIDNINNNVKPNIERPLSKFFGD